VEVSYTSADSLDNHPPPINENYYTDALQLLVRPNCVGRVCVKRVCVKRVCATVCKASSNCVQIESQLRVKRVAVCKASVCKVTVCEASVCKARTCFPRKRVSVEISYTSADSLDNHPPPINENYYTDALQLLIRPNCVVNFVCQKVTF
jgi:hypothetical protein